MEHAATGFILICIKIVLLICTHINPTRKTCEKMYITNIGVIVALLASAAQCAPPRQSSLAEHSDVTMHQRIRKQLVRDVAWRTALAATIANTADVRRRLAASAARLSGRRLHCSARAHAILHSLNVLCGARAV